VFVVDTNVLVYAANEDAPAHCRCRQMLEECDAGITGDRHFSSLPVSRAG
jgi:predicted nucleic acid-binding protein